MVMVAVKLAVATAVVLLMGADTVAVGCKVCDCVAVAVGGSLVGDAVLVGVAGRGVGVAVGVRVLVLVGVAGVIGAPTGAKKV